MTSADVVALVASNASASPVVSPADSTSATPAPAVAEGSRDALTAAIRLALQHYTAPAPIPAMVTAKKYSGTVADIPYCT